MKKSLLTVALATAVMIAWSIGRVQGQAWSKNKVIYVSANEANYQAMATNPNASTAAIFGDANKGAHATFSKFAPGYDAGMHTHTNDVWIVGVKGAYLYKDEDGEKRIGPGVFLRLPAATSTGVAAIPKRERFFTKNRPESSTWFLQIAASVVSRRSSVFSKPGTQRYSDD